MTNVDIFILVQNSWRSHHKRPQWNDSSSYDGTLANPEVSVRLVSGKVHCEVKLAWRKCQSWMLPTWRQLLGRRSRHKLQMQHSSSCEVADKKNAVWESRVLHHAVGHARTIVRKDLNYWDSIISLLSNLQLLEMAHRTMRWKMGTKPTLCDEDSRAEPAEPQQLHHHQLSGGSSSTRL